MTANKELTDKIVNPRKMIRKERYSVTDILSKAKTFFQMKKSDRRARVDFDGDIMKMASDRYKCFVASGVKCVCCGLEGSYFYKEKDAKSELEIYHFNLYAIDSLGNEVLMTKDHIIPRSRGGKDHVDNYQTMCSECNERKGNKLPEKIGA